MKSRSLEAAQIEFAEAIEHHRQISSDLGVEFQRAVHHAVLKIFEFPTMWPCISGEYRRCRVKKFKYGVVYRVDNDELVIVAFMHLSRDPDYWKKRE